MVQVSKDYINRKSLRVAGVDTSKRVNLITHTDLEDIGEQAVAEAVRRVDRKKSNGRFKGKVHFTGYFKKGGTQIFAFKRNNSEITQLRIKGGPHRVVDIPMDSYDRRQYLLQAARMMGFKAHKCARGEWRIYVGKK